MLKPMEIEHEAGMRPSCIGEGVFKDLSGLGNQAPLPRILVAEDDPSTSRIMHRRLSRQGFEVVMVSNGLEVLEQIACQSFDLVILDVMMPKLNGLEVLHLIRVSHSSVDLPVIIVSTLDGSDDVVGAFDLGANDYIAKPVDFDVAIARIRSQLRCRSYRVSQEDSFIRGGRYQIQKVLGKGGFSTTFLAVDTQMPSHPLCVIKQMRLADELEEGTDTFLKRLDITRRLFDREAKTLERLGHCAFIPQLLAYFEENKKFHLVYSYIDGETIRERLNTGVRWDEYQVMNLLCHVLQTLKFIHDNGVIHRDIKPDNIVCHEREGHPAFSLIDFGAVKELGMGQEGRVLTAFVGTPGYAPYEQFRGRPRFNSDIYALGRVALECLTGISPDREEGEEELALGSYLVARLQISNCLKKVLSRMICTDPVQRYQTADQALENIRRFCRIS